MLKVKNDIKKIKADRLISITSVYDNGENTLYYHFSRNDEPEITEFSIKVPEGEQVESIIEVYANAALLETELTELFGVKFKGNKLSGTRLFLAEGETEHPMCVGSRAEMEMKKNA